MNVESILAPNPGLFTGPGTNTYLIDSPEGLLVVDPGPVDARHRAAIEERVGDRRPAAVVVTHTHPDHAPLANPLARHYGVPAVGYAPGPDFEPDLRVAEGDAIGPARVLYTPGHAADHVCLLVDDVLFTGDHIMGGSTVMVEDMGSYLASLERLRRLELRRLLPGHGPEIEDPQAIIDYYIAHRLERERQIVEAVGTGARSVGEVVASVYADVDSALHPIAAMSVAAHLRKLAAEGVVEFDEASAADTWHALVAMVGG